MKKTYSEIGVDKLVPYSEHLFSLYDEDRLKELAQSVKEHGVLTPLIVRKYDFKGNYMILAGHNRCNAAKHAGLKTVPCIVVEKLTEDEEKLITIETNINQRSIDSMKTSELAKALDVWYSLIKKQGYRSDLVDEIEELEIVYNKSAEAGKSIVNSFNQNSEKMPANPDEIRANGTSGNDCRKSDGSAIIISEKTKLSPRSIRNYVRVAKLPKEILEYVDNGNITMVAAVELSYIKPAILTHVINAMSLDALKITTVSNDAAKKLRTLNNAGSVTLQEVINILKPATVKTVGKITLKPEIITAYFSGKPKKVVMQKVKSSLELTEKQIPKLFAEHDIEIGEDYYKAIYDILCDYFNELKSEQEQPELDDTEA